MQNVIHHTEGNEPNPVPVTLLPNLGEGNGSFEGPHDRDGVLLGARVMLRLVEAQNESRTDELTGLPNRRGFDEGLSNLVESVQGQDEPHLAMMFIDLDNFKNVNDTHERGHEAGDTVLQAVSEILRLNLKLRDDEVVGRVGGDEFAAAIRTKNTTNSRRDKEMTDDEVEKGFIDRVTAEVAKLALEMGMPSLGVSIGVVEYRKGETAQEFRSRADLEMYRIKEERKAAVHQPTSKIRKIGRAIVGRVKSEN